MSSKLIVDGCKTNNPADPGLNPSLRPEDSAQEVFYLIAGACNRGIQSTRYVQNIDGAWYGVSEVLDAAGAVIVPTPKLTTQEDSRCQSIGSSAGGPVDPCCPADLLKLEEMRVLLAQLAGNTDTIETLQQGTTTAVNALQGLINNLLANTDQLEGFAQQFNLNTDGLETTLEQIRLAVLAQVDTEYFQGLTCVDGTTRPYRIATAFKMLDGTISNESAIESWDGTGWFPIVNNFAFKDGSCEEIEKFRVLNQTLFEIKKLNLVEACVSFPAGTTSTIQKFRVDALWGPNTDANGDPDGTFYGGFAEIRKEGLPVVPLQTIPHVAGSFTATGFSSAGTAFGIVWDVDTLFFGSQTITANGQPAPMNAQGQANDNVSLSYTYVDVVTTVVLPAQPSVSKLVDFSQPTPVYYELDGVTVYVKPANAIVKLGAACPKTCTDPDVPVVKECNSDLILAATLANAPLPQTFDLVAREHLAQIEQAIEKPRVTTEHMRLVDPVTGVAESPATTIIVTSTYAVGSSVPSNSYVNMNTGAAWVGNPETKLRALPPPALPVIPVVAPVELAITSKFTRASGSTTIAAGYKSLSVLAISNNVTIDGQAIPQNVSTQVGSASMERFSDTITIIGTDYFVTETR